MLETLGYILHATVTNLTTPLTAAFAVIGLGLLWACVRLRRGRGILTHALAYLLGTLGLAFAVTSQTGPLFVPNLSVLNLLPSTQYLSVYRMGYASIGDAPTLLYTPRNSACSIASGSGDGGYQVQSQDLKCFIATPPSSGMDVREWGAKCDGSTNDFTSFAKANTAVTNGLQSRIYVPATGFGCVINSGITLNNNSKFYGNGVHGFPGTNSNCAQWAASGGSWIFPGDLVNTEIALIGNGSAFEHLNVCLAQPQPPGGSYTPTVYPFALSIQGTQSQVRDVQVIGAYEGLNLGYNNVSAGGTGVVIEDVYMSAFHRCLAENFTNDVVAVRNFQCRNLFHASDGTVVAYLEANLIGIDAHYWDNPFIDGFECFNCLYGMLFTNDTLFSVTHSMFNAQVDNIQCNLVVHCMSVATGTTTITGQYGKVQAQGDVSTSQNGTMFALGSNNVNVSFSALHVPATGGSVMALGNGTSGVVTFGSNPVVDAYQQITSSAEFTLATGAVYHSQIPHVATNANLAAASSALYPFGVVRDDFGSGIGAPPLLYRPLLSSGLNIPCTVNAGAGDGGYQVPSADGKCWIATFPAAGTAVEEWGCDPTGTVDASACLNTALSGLASAGGHILFASNRYLVTSANVSVPTGICLEGPWGRPALVPNGDYTDVSALVISSSFTLTGQDGGCIRHLIVARQGLLNPGAVGTTAAQNLQTAYAQIAAFSGTGITLPTGGSFSLENVLVLGFSTCVSGTNTQLPNLQGVWGDCNGGISLSEIGELGVISHNHFWPFLNYGGPTNTYENGVSGSSVYFYGPAITGIANNGSGLIRLTIGGGHNYVTGNVVMVAGAPSNTNANNTFAKPTWTLTVIDSTHVDLQGSTFANTGSTGNVYATVVMRSGAAYRYQNVSGVGCDHCEMIDNDEFNYQNGLWATSSDHMRVTDFRADAWFNAQQQTTNGVLVDGTSSDFGLDNSAVSAYAIGLNYAATGGVIPYSSFTNVHLYGCVVASIEHNSPSGFLNINGGIIDSTPPASLGGQGSCGITNTSGGTLRLGGGLFVNNNSIATSGGGTTTIADAVDANGVLLANSINAINIPVTMTVLTSSESYFTTTGRPMLSPTNMGSSYCIAGTAATSTATFHVLHNGSSYGTATFSASGTVAAFSAPATLFAIGDVFTFQAPSSVDATLANVACAFRFSSE